jgi:glycosyltransferase involved in cell wall biosynthesis
VPDATLAPIITHISEPVTGGVGRQVELVAHALPACGFRLHLIVSLARDPAFARSLEAYEAEGIGTDVVPFVRRPCPVRDPWSYLRLKRVLRRVRPALVHTHSSKAGMLGRRAAHALGIPCVHTPHVFAFEWAKSGVRRCLFRILERRAARWCDRIVLLSDAQRELAFTVGLGPIERLDVIPNGVDAEQFRPAVPEERRAARKRFGVTVDVPVVGMAARFEPQKGVGDFLRAAAGLRQRIPRVRFLLAGDGSMEEEARQRVDRLGLTDAVSFCGNVTHMLEFYHALDAFVLASLWEGCPDRKSVV